MNDNRYSGQKRPPQSRPQGQRPPEKRPAPRPAQTPVRPLQRTPERPTQRPAPRPVGTAPRPQGRPAPQPQSAQRPSSDKLLYTVIAITAVAVVALIIVMLVFAVTRATGCRKDPDNDRGNDITNNSGNDGGSAAVSAQLGETEDMGQSYIDSMIFVGDSNTAHLRSYAVLTGGKETKQVWAPKSQTITLNNQITSVKIVYPETDEEMTIAEAVKLKKPKYLVISLGTNGLTYLDKDGFVYCYNKLLNAIKTASPDTKIIVQSIYPVTTWYESIPNSKINEANGWLLELAKEAGIKYIDTASVLKDASGALKEEYNSDHRDGYHVNAAAYEEILKYIRTHGYQ